VGNDLLDKNGGCLRSLEARQLCSLLVIWISLPNFRNQRTADLLVTFLVPNYNYKNSNDPYQRNKVKVDCRLSQRLHLTNRGDCSSPPLGTVAPTLKIF